MSGPTFVNAGTFAGTSSNTVTIALPGSRTNGNLLLAWVRAQGTTTLQTWSLDSTSISNGWTLGSTTINQGGTRPMVFAWRLVDGSEAAPKFNITNSTTVIGQCNQYATPIYSTPIGNVSQNSNNTAVTTATCPAVTATSPNSLAVNIDANFNSTAPPTPSGWSSETSSGSVSGAVRAADIALVNTGDSSGSISVTISSSTYGVFNIEIRSSSSSANATASQTVPDFTSSETVAVTITATASQTIPNFTSAETVAVSSGVSASQTIPNFTSAETVAVSVAVSASQTIPNFASSETVSVALQFSASQIIPNFGAGETVGVGIQAQESATIPPFAQVATFTGPAPFAQIFKGVIGEVKVNRKGLATLEARGLLTLGRGVITERYGPMCRNDLGDDAGEEGSGGTCMIPILPSDVQRSTAYITKAGATRIDQAYVRARTASAGNPSDYANVYYECTTAGATAGTAPSYDPVVGHTTVDGTATFTTRNAWLRYAQVASVIDDFTFTLTAHPDTRDVDGWFALGEGIVRSGPRTGFPFHMKAWAHFALKVTTFNIISDMLAPGYWVELSAGCDKRPVTCNGTFSNIANYRGEDFTPGRDLPLTQN
jgi:hypothetical protein